MSNEQVIKFLKEYRKRCGYWILANDIGDCCYRCSECGFVRDAYLLDEAHYCPSCGKKMSIEEKK